MSRGIALFRIRFPAPVKRRPGLFHMMQQVDDGLHVDLREKAKRGGQLQCRFYLRKGRHSAISLRRCLIVVNSDDSMAVLAGASKRGYD